MKPLTLKIVTPTRELFNGPVDHALLPGVEGQFGVLADHAPLLSILDVGYCEFKSAGTKRTVSITGGFAEVSENTMTVIARSAEFVEEIDAERAERARARAADRLSARASGTDLPRAKSARRRAVIRLRLAKSRRPA